MTDFNSTHNRVVWCDIPVADLDRACKFYAAVLANKVHREEFGGKPFGVLDHHDGNGGCLIPDAGSIANNGGVLVYFNTDGRIQDAVRQAASLGAEILEPVHMIGPHGFRALLRDSEGNRIALHSRTDA
jgi:uncharacterized protein